MLVIAQLLSKIRSRHIVAIAMLLCFWSMTLGPQTNPPTGTLKFAEESLGIRHEFLAIACLVGGIWILWFKLQGFRYQLATSPLVCYIVFVNMNVVRSEINWTAIVLYALLYILILRVSGGEK